jgi:hypothetical protein
MEPPPFSEKLFLVLGHDPESLASVGLTHVVVLPEGGSIRIIAQPDEDLSSILGLNMDMRRLVFSWR